MENHRQVLVLQIKEHKTQSLHHSVSIFGFLTAKKSPRYTRPNTPTRARTIKNESLKSSAWFSLAWCCLLISLFICFSFLVSWPILFLHEVLFSNNQNIDQDLPKSLKCHGLTMNWLWCKYFSKMLMVNFTWINQCNLKN